METAMKSINISNSYSGGSGKYANPFAMDQREKNTSNLFEDSYTSCFENVDSSLSLIYEEIDNQSLGQAFKGFVKDFKRMLVA